MLSRGRSPHLPTDRGAALRTVAGDAAAAGAILRDADATVVLHAAAWPADPADVSVSVLDGGQLVTSGLPPYDLGDVPAPGELPVIPGASVAVRYRFLAGPFGPVDMTQRFVDGELATVAFVGDPGADVFVEISYANYLRVRLGECSVIDALEGGRLFGATGPLSMLAGLLESPEYEATWQANRPVSAALYTVADHFPLEAPS